MTSAPTGLPRGSRRLVRALALSCGVLIAIVVVLLWFINRPGPELRRLREEAIATYVPPGASQTFRRDSNAGAVPIAGSRGSAQISRRLGDCPERCFEDVTRHATLTGWKFPGSVDQQPGSKLLFRTVPNGYLELRINAQDAGNPTECALSLTYRRGLTPSEWSSTS